MNKKESDFRKRLLLTFKVEAEDHLKAMASGLIELEKEPLPDTQKGIVETVFREAHSLKGAARAVNMADIESVCRSLENIFAVWKQGKIDRSSGCFDVLYQAIDIIRTLASSSEEQQPSLGKTRIPKLIHELARLESGGHEAALADDKHGRPTENIVKENVWEDVQRTQVSFPGARDSMSPVPRGSFLERERRTLADTIRIPTAKLSSLMLKAEEMLAIKPVKDQHYTDLKELVGMVETLKAEQKEMSLAMSPARPNKKNVADKKDESALPSARVQDFIRENQSRIRAIEDKLLALMRSSGRYNKTLDRMVDNLLGDVKKVMLLPFSILLEGFPMLVRNISHEQNKEVELVIRGEGIEIDRRILEEIKDPLVHLVRNCIDHGIENPDVRTRNKKPRQGVIAVSISQVNGNNVEVSLSDDGAGIDVAEVKRAAVKHGVLSNAEAEKLSEQEAIALVFQSGVSTTPLITDISGRGLGLAIVQERVEKLGGSIAIKTAANTGTTFRILLPLTIATYRGILVEAAGATFILPTTAVERAFKIKNADIKTVENKETITVNDQPISFVRLDRVLEMPPVKAKQSESQSSTALVIHGAEKRMAFCVDRVLGEREVLVKGLGKQLSRVRNVAGAAILESGRPVPVLNVYDLMKSAVRISQEPAMHGVAGRDAEAAEKKSILIAEDSITSRILLKNILESAGYNVKTAVDGMDAITQMKMEKFDLLVSDVEMPRMNGFELTRKVRDDKKLAGVPVVLVTALASKEDREQGIHAGASAYIVKSSFDQGNLLEIVRRLI